MRKGLSAGIVNGKNIWRADYAQKNALLAEIVSAVGAENVVVGTSCSLLHVPYTVAAEQKLSADILKHFAFAEEKLVELAELASGDAAALEKNKALFATPRVQANAKVQAELAALPSWALQHR